MSLQPPDWDLDLSRYSHSTGYHVLGGNFSRFVKSPTTAHCVAAKCMLRYLPGAPQTEFTIEAVTHGSRIQNGILTGGQRIATVIGPEISRPGSSHGL